MTRILTLRRILIALPLLILAAALLFVRFALPGLLQQTSERWLLEHTGHHLRMDRPEIQLFGPRVVLQHLALSEADGQPLLGFSRLEVAVAWAPLLGGVLRFDEIRLDDAHATVTIRPDGRLNWSTLIERLQGPAPASPPPARQGKAPALEIAALAIHAAVIDASDQRIGLVTHTTPLDLTLHDLSTDSDAAGRFALSAVTSLGARLQLSGQATLQPVKASGTVQLAGLDLAQLAPLIDAHAPVRVPSGVADLGFQFRFAYQPGRADLDLDGVQASLRDLRLQPAGNPAAILRVGEISLDQGHFALAPQQASASSLRIAGTQLDLPRPGGAPVHLALGSVALEQISADLAAHHADVARLALGEGVVQLVRARDGQLDLLAALKAMGSAAPAAEEAPAAPRPADSGKAGGSRPGASKKSAAQPADPAVTAAPAAGAPWRVALGKFALTGFQAGLRDETVTPAAELGIEQLHLEASGLSEQLSRPLPFEAGFAVRSGGRFQAHGTLTPAPLAAEVDFRLDQLGLPVAQAYIAPLARLRLASGSFSVGGHASVGGRAGPRFQGDFDLQQLQLREMDSGNLFLGLKSFGTRKLTASSHRLDIPQLTLVGLDTQLLIAKDKSVNLSRILAKPGAPAQVPAGTGTAAASAHASAHAPASAPAAAVSAPAPAAPPAKPDPAAFQASVDQLRISDSALDFADQSLALPFGTRIHDLHGVINGLSARSDARGQIQLDGQVDDYGSANAEGQLDLFNPTGYTDIKVVFRNVEMTRLTPYSATFAGRRIASGKLSLDLDYKIKQRQLEGSNSVVMDQLTLGERVDTPGATNLPLDLAIAILQDSDGRIDLGLPVSGSLDDPQFSYGRIIWKAIVNVIGKIVLSPFRALGALFGGSGDKFESVLFQPASATLAPPEREKLVKIAGALAKRPGIALGVPAPYSPEDQAALQDLQLRRAITARAGQPLAPDQDPGPLALRSPDVQAAIEAEFSARLGAATLESLRKSLPAAAPGDAAAAPPDSWYQDLLQRLRATQTVGEPELQALARQRAATVVAGLQAAGLPAARLNALDPARVEAQDGSVPIKFAPASGKNPS